jgi:hypothetical protein
MGFCQNRFGINEIALTTMVRGRKLMLREIVNDEGYESGFITRESRFIFWSQWEVVANALAGQSHWKRSSENWNSSGVGSQ